MTDKPTTQNGTVLHLRPVSDFLITDVRTQARDDFKATHGDLLTPPTYDIECGGGIADSWIETHIHKEDTIEDGTDEEKAAWQIYLEQQSELNGLIWERTSRHYFLDGMQDPPENGWVERQERRGVTIPDDPDERKLHWIRTEVIVSRSELSWLAHLIQGQSNFTEAGRQLAADMFRHTMEQIRRANAVRDSGKTV